jgi:hypothetical protein
MWEVMAEFGAVTTPRAKRRKILRSIARFEKRPAQAQADLSRVTACLVLPPRCVILRSAKGLTEWAEHPSLKQGMLGRTPSAVKPLAPRGTGSDGSRLHQRGNIPPTANDAPRRVRFPFPRRACASHFKAASRRRPPRRHRLPRADLSLSLSGVSWRRYWGGGAEGKWSVTNRGEGDRFSANCFEPS